MTVSAVSSTNSTTSTSTSTTTSSSSSSSTTYSTFLTMLTTELSNQDPLNPMDTSQFTNQLISLSSMEQLLSMNDKMSTLVSDFSSLSASNGVSYIGKTIEASGDVAELSNDNAEWGYSLASTASSVTLTVTDSSGDVVYTGSGDTTSGSHTFTWNGVDTSGSQLGSGAYTLSVAATSSAGSTVSTSTTVYGTVTGVDTSSGSTYLDLGGVSVSLSDVLQVAS